MDWRPEDLSPEQRQEMVEHYKKHMIYGLLWFAGGSLITFVTLQSGNRVIVAWGAILWGIIDFFKGLNGYLTFK